MPKLQDYRCRTCTTHFEYLHQTPEDMQVCPVCGSNEADLQLGGRQLTTIVPAYPGCKKVRAGYVHTHGDRPAEKISVSVPRSIGEKP